MTVMVRAELAPFLECKTPSCRNVALASRGPYAGLCAQHRSEKAEEISEKTRAGLDRRHRRGFGLVPLAHTVLSATEQLERRLQRYDQRGAALEQAIADFGLALHDLREALQDLRELGALRITETLDHNLTTRRGGEDAPGDHDRR